MTRLRQKMLEELQRRNYAKSTIRHYIERSPISLNTLENHRTNSSLITCVRTRPISSETESVAVGTVVARVAALRFFFIRTLKRPQFREDLPSQNGLANLPRF